MAAGFQHGQFTFEGASSGSYFRIVARLRLTTVEPLGCASIASANWDYALPFGKPGRHGKLPARPRKLFASDRSGEVHKRKPVEGLWVVLAQSTCNDCRGRAARELNLRRPSSPGHVTGTPSCSIRSRHVHSGQHPAGSGWDGFKVKDFQAFSSGQATLGPGKNLGSGPQAALEASTSISNGGLQGCHVLLGEGEAEEASISGSDAGTLAHTTYFLLSNIKVLPGPDWSPGSSFVDIHCGMASQDQDGVLPYLSFRPWGDPNLCCFSSTHSADSLFFFCRGKRAKRESLPGLEALPQRALSKFGCPSSVGCLLRLFTEGL